MPTRRILPLAAALVLAAAPLAPPLGAASAQQLRITKDSGSEAVSLTGRVADVAEDHFTLRDRNATIVVEMAGRPWRRQAMLAPGDRVAVTGRLAVDFAESRTIEAASVAVPKLRLAGAPDGDWIAATGVVVARDGDLLTLDTGQRRLTIDADAVLGEPAGTPVGIGSRISVAGIVADSVAGVVADAAAPVPRRLQAASLSVLPDPAS